MAWLLWLQERRQSWQILPPNLSPTPDHLFQMVLQPTRFLSSALSHFSLKSPSKGTGQNPILGRSLLNPCLACNPSPESFYQWQAAIATAAGFNPFLSSYHWAGLYQDSPILLLTHPKEGLILEKAKSINDTNPRMGWKENSERNAPAKFSDQNGPNKSQK